MNSTFLSFDTRRYGDTLIKVSGIDDIVTVYIWNLYYGDGQLRFFEGESGAEEAYTWINYMTQKYV